MYKHLRYWCADQMMVQKALSARSLSDAQGATIFTGWIKVTSFGFSIVGGYWSRRHIHEVCFSGFSAMLDLSMGGCSELLPFLLSKYIKGSMT